MLHVSANVLWKYGCRAAALDERELEHVLSCLECEQLLDQIEEVLDEITKEHDQSVN